MFYVLWITLCIIYYSFAAWLSKKLNDDPECWRWFWMLVGIQILGIWPLVAKYSKNLVFDAMLFDFILLIVYWSTLFFLGAGKNMTPMQGVAVGIILAGLLMYKLGGYHEKDNVQTMPTAQSESVSDCLDTEQVRSAEYGTENQG